MQQQQRRPHPPDHGMEPARHGTSTAWSKYGMELHTQHGQAIHGGKPCMEQAMIPTAARLAIPERVAVVAVRCETTRRE